MRIAKVAQVAAALVLGAALFTPFARAQEGRQLTKMTFDQPVQIPGHVLAAGTYWFQVADPSHGMDTVQVLNERKDVVTTLMTVPITRVYTDYRGDGRVEFFDRGGGPFALDFWFYPTQTEGHVFVYPQERVPEE